VGVIPREEKGGLRYMPQGTVKWFNSEKGYGFISAISNKEAKCEASTKTLTRPRSERRARKPAPRPTLRHRWVRDALVALLSQFHVGSDRFAVKVEAEGLIGERPVLYSCSIRGHGEGRATGIVAASVVERLSASPGEPGVFHIEQLFDPVKLFGGVEDRGLTVDLQDVRF
jgi:hypothetical protein